VLQYNQLLSRGAQVKTCERQTDFINTVTQ